MKRITYEYKVVTNSDGSAKFQEDLNKLGNEGWRVTHSLGRNEYNRETVLMEKKIDYKEDLSRQGY